MRKTYEKNMADTALVVKSLKVLEKIDGGGIKEIKNSVESVKRQTTAQAKQQEEYWRTLSDDGVITVIEKQTLYRETQNIARSYAAITQQAQALGMPSSLVADYIATYNALHTYLYTTLKIFDDMSVETKIDNRDTFNAYFSNYYFSENFVLIAITNGILDSINFRVLQSLTEPGTEGETAIYHGGLYQYINGQWKSVSTGAYKGPRNELPADEEEAFFIVSESFTMTEGLIVNGEELYVNGDLLGITHTYLKGQIYYFQNGIWKAEHDRTNWRYAAAFADVINITGELPQIFQDAIDDLQEQINTKASAQSLQEEIAARQGQNTIINGDIIRIDDAIQDIVDRANGVDESLRDQAAELRDQAAELRDQAAELESQGQDVTSLLSRADALETQAQNMESEISGKISHLPVYGGARSTAPAGPLEGDFFLYTGTGEDYLKVKRYSNNVWETLNPTFSAHRNYYMMALEDILAQENAGTGIFTQLFCQAFWTASATITTLDVKTIYLRQYGAIQSANTTYVKQRVGLRQDAAGNIDANGDTHIAGKVAIGVDLYNAQNQYMPDFVDYDIVIDGKARFKGELDTDKDVHLHGRTVIEGDAHFDGEIEAGPLKLLSTKPTPRSETFYANTNYRSTDFVKLTGGNGTYKGLSFTWVKAEITGQGGGTWGVPYWCQYTISFINNGTTVYSEKYTSESSVYFQLTEGFTYNWYIADDAKTFSLVNIPESKPVEPNIVYRDGDILKIS